LQLPSQCASLLAQDYLVPSFRCGQGSHHAPRSSSCYENPALWSSLPKGVELFSPDARVGDTAHIQASKDALAATFVTGDAWTDIGKLPGLGFLGKVRICNQGASHRNEIYPALPNQVVGQNRVIDPANPDHWNVHRFLHGLGYRDQEPWRHSHRGTGHVLGFGAASQDFDGTGSPLLKEADDLPALVKGQTALQTFVHGHSAHNREFWTQCLTDSVDDLHNQSRSSLSTATVLVRAPVGVGRNELVQEISIGYVEQNRIKVSFSGPSGCLDKPEDNVLDLLRIQLSGHLSSDTGNRRRRKKRPSYNRSLSASPTVREFNRHLGASVMNGLGQLCQSGNQAIVVDRQTIWR
jgi:hypothetical protein